MISARYLLPLCFVWVLAHARDFDTDTIRVAVSDWLEDPKAATTKYGAPIEEWKTWRVTDMAHLFQGAENFTANLKGWDTSSVTDMNHLFAGCSSFDSPLDSWDVSAVTDFSLMFYGASSFTGDSLGNWDTSSVESMEQMFFDTFRCGGFEPTTSRCCINSCSSFLQQQVIINNENEFAGYDGFGTCNGWDISSRCFLPIG